MAMATEIPADWRSASYAEIAEALRALPALVREKRQADGLSQRALARMIGCSFATINRFEDGKDVILSNALLLLDWMTGNHTPPGRELQTTLLNMAYGWSEYARDLRRAQEFISPEEQREIDAMAQGLHLASEELKDALEDAHGAVKPKGEPSRMDNAPAVGAPKYWKWGYLPCGCMNDGYGRHVR